MTGWRGRVAFAATILLLGGCGSDLNHDRESELDSQVRQLAAAQGLTGDPAAGKEIPRIEDPLCQLGLKLFFTKGLGGDLDSACVTCHHPVLGGGDALSLPVGVGAVEPDLLGPGRDHSAAALHYDGGPTVPRNAPTTFNIALWQTVLFWDGRVEKLQDGIHTPDVSVGQVDPDAADLVSAQARFPVTSPEEMRGFSFEAGNSNAQLRSHLEARIGDFGQGAGELEFNRWQDEFDAVYGPGAEITFERIVEAIGGYERSQVFVDAPWKAYLGGDEGALDSAAKRGALLFFRPYGDGGFGCSACHAGDFFTDEKFHVMAVPQVGRGKGNGPQGDDDFGRFNVTGDPDDLYAFRTPTLWNVAQTGPWGHAGAYLTLEQMIRHMLDPETAVGQFDASVLNDYNAPLQVQGDHADTHTALALARLQENRALGLSPHRPMAYEAGQVADLVAFLRALTDPCVTDRGCLEPWLPAAGETDPDGLRVEAVDGEGQPLQPSAVL